MDLTWTLEDGPRHENIQRFDRLARRIPRRTLGRDVGRDAISWGSGIVFQPLDIFAPFAPTTVDRDYKPGEDLVKVDGVTEHGSDWQLLGVFRRNLRRRSHRVGRFVRRQMAQPARRLRGGTARREALSRSRGRCEREARDRRRGVAHRLAADRSRRRRLQNVRRGESRLQLHVARSQLVRVRRVFPQRFRHQYTTGGPHQVAQGAQRSTCCAANCSR